MALLDDWSPKAVVVAIERIGTCYPTRIARLSRCRRIAVSFYSAGDLSTQPEVFWIFMCSLTMGLCRPLIARRFVLLQEPPRHRLLRARTGRSADPRGPTAEGVYWRTCSAISGGRDDPLRSSSLSSTHIRPVSILNVLVSSSARGSVCGDWLMTCEYIAMRDDSRCVRTDTCSTPTTRCEVRRSRVAVAARRDQRVTPESGRSSRRVAALVHERFSG